MRKKIFTMVFIAILTGLGLSQIQVEALLPIFERFIPSAEAAVPFPTWDPVPYSFKADYYAPVGKEYSEVGALRPPSAHHRVDRSCCLCHVTSGTAQSKEALRTSDPSRVVMATRRET